MLAAEVTIVRTARMESARTLIHAIAVRAALVAVIVRSVNIAGRIGEAVYAAAERQHSSVIQHE